MSDHETRFSKVRLEMLCDGIFTVAMTLLVLELKPPELPRHTPPAEIWHALREHGLSFVGFGLTFLLAGASWIAHHRLFQHLRTANRALVMLTIPFLMFVTLLPFSTSMLTAFGPQSPVSLTFYLGNQFALSALLAIQWLVAQRSGLIATADDDPERRRFARFVIIQPISFLISLAVAYVSPRNAMLAAAMSIGVLNGLARRLDKAR
jgi:uncharacterized membrane protein